MRPQIVKLGFAFLVGIAACQGPDEYSWGPPDGGGIDSPVVSGQGGTVTGLGGNPGTGGQPTGLGGSPTGAAGTTGSPVGTAGTTGNAGTNGAAGTNGRGGTTGNAGTNGTAGTTGTSTVLFSDDFESNTVGATTATNWSRAGGSSGDWVIATDGTKVLQQEGSTSSTVRFQSLTGAGSSGAPWSGALSISARVKIIATGSSNQTALVCVRYNDTSNRYCGALVPGGVQILTSVGGSAGGSAVFSTTVATGTFYDLRVSVDASNVLTVYLGGTQRGTYTPAAMTNGTVAVGTASMQAAFDNISVTRP